MIGAAADLVDCVAEATAVELVDCLTGVAAKFVDCVTRAASVELALILTQITSHTKSPVR